MAGVGIAAATLVVTIVGVVVPAKRARREQREARPRAMLVGGVESMPGIWLSQRVAIWNEGGTDLPTTRVDVLSFPFVFMDAVARPQAPTSGVCLGALDVAEAARSASVAPVMFSKESARYRQAGRVLLAAGGLPQALVAFVPTPRAPSGPLIDAIYLAPERLFHFSVRLHVADGRSMDLLVENHTSAPNLDSLGGDFREIALACAPTGWSTFTLPHGTNYKRFLTNGTNLASFGDGTF